MDIHFQPVPASEVRGWKIFTFGFIAALKVSGIQALVNRWIKTFLTPLGSDLLHPDNGTDFSNLIGGNFGSQSDNLQDLVVIAIDETNEQIKKQDIAGFFSADESLSDAQLKAYVPTSAGDGFEIWVEIHNVAGTVITTKLMELATR
jgi:hypothetical protein